MEGQPLVICLEQGEIDSLELSSGILSLRYNSVRSNTPIQVPGIRQGTELQFRYYTEEGGWQPYTLEYSSMPGWLSLIPPLLAIVCAILFREVVTSLFIGILSGVFLNIHYAMPGKPLLSGVFLSISDYVLPALNDTGHLSVIVFSLLIGGLVALISRNGGMAGMVRYVARFARNRQSTQIATWLLGIVIFFDDYANTLVVGNTMRPVTDRMRISREKLAYLVDSTAAPVASVAFVTTWIGAQLGYIQDGINSLSDLNTTAYSVFMGSLSYAFYPVFTLAFILILILSRKEYGPMHGAEKRILEAEEPDHSYHGGDGSGELEPDDETPRRAFNAVIPVLVLIGGTLAGLWITGYSDAIWHNPELGFWKRLSGVVGAADSYKALLWSSAGALLLAVVLTVSQRIMNLDKSIGATLKGFGFMLQAIVILCLAWSLSSLTETLNTAVYITSVLEAIHANPVWFPALTFILSALVSFSTGSSWSTMAILYPMILPAVWLLSGQHDVDTGMQMSLFLNVVSCVLAGSVMGDHCSPISDTTILSSLASSCDHLSHVRTQLPYSLSVGAVSVLLGTVPASFGISSWLLFPLGILAIYLIIRIFGRPLPKF